ncbi:hypothetical protein N7495_005945 [Penicillium taxi]|uniref:uncharacterized protein n=1 Tax=Penicillium taxi TaxID=168475 RepID=UPI0025453797|nr:uncharacterized protein N7495_005945 [Penicillium taxi]KAJ5894254.1 hypothetical protein N7495_005945 [Penicillium taxi]
MSEDTGVQFVGARSKVTTIPKERGRTRRQVSQDLNGPPDSDSVGDETDVQFLGARAKRPRHRVSEEDPNSPAFSSRQPSLRSRRSLHSPFHPMDRQIERPQDQLILYQGGSVLPQSVGRQNRDDEGIDLAEVIDLTIDEAVDPSGGVDRPPDLRPRRHLPPLHTMGFVSLEPGQSQPRDESAEDPEVEFVRSIRRAPSDNLPSHDHIPLGLIGGRHWAPWYNHRERNQRFLRPYPYGMDYDTPAWRTENTRLLFEDLELPPFIPPLAPLPTEPPVYKAPSPAPDGFTRNLAEDDVAICPHCDSTLGTGEGKKREIWLAKACGHAYCGDCASNRSQKAAQTNAAEPFSKCQVPECGQKVSSKSAMIQLFI